MLFLICSERSGSNLIRAMLDAHPRIAAPQPLHFLRDVIARADALPFGARDAAAAEVMRAQLARSIGKQFAPDDAARIVARAEAAEPFTPREILRAVYGGVAEVTGADLLMIKENELQNAAAQIIDAFPDAQFLFQVRDPRDYLASALALKEGRFGNKFGGFRNAMRLWSEDQQFGLRMLGHFGPERVFFQRYEDLVANPEAVLRQVCAFAGLPFAPEMLRHHEASGVQEFSTRKAAWENLSRPVMADNFNKYRQSLSARQIAGVEAALGPLMDRFGYARDAGQTGKWSLIWPSLVEPLERWSNKSWTPFHTVANTKHHKKLDAAAEPLPLRYANTDTRGFAPGQWPRTALERVLESAAQHPDRAALRVDGEDWSYDRLFGAAAALARSLPEDRPVVGIYAARHVSAYIGILAVMMAGGAYVPLNCRFPAARNRTIAARAGLDHILHGAEFADAVAEIADGLPVTCLNIPTDAPPLSESEAPLSRPGLGDTAYILFTSGSTGTPKGVPISHGNLAAYLGNALEALRPAPEDRFSQTFDLTFDLSVHDLFVCWSAGACLCVASQADLSDPAGYVTRERITHWFSVPSLAYTLRQTGKLTEGALPSVTTSLFCGEALPADLARDWHRATGKARLENWYGPTEATIACTRHVFAPEDPATGTVPIGRAFDGMTALVIGEDGKPVADGQTGALYLGGAQIADGYLNAPEQTARSFVTLPGRSGRFYDTGDLVSRVGGVLQFHGRRDFQVKIRGYRVELGEIEAALRAQSGGDNVVALTWPHGSANATHVVAVFERDDESPVLDRAPLAAELPDYMIPSSAFGLRAFPTNASGKTDRAAIAAAIEARIAARRDAADGSFEGRVLALILRVKPTLDAERIKDAESLLWAGLDSLDFVNLTHLFETELDVTLTEARVAALANMTFPDLVRDLQSGQAASSAISQIPAERMRRANRALAFVRGFPGVVTRSRAPLLLAFGSSGTMRAIDTGAAQDAAGAQALDCRVINAGLPALTSAGLARMARFVAETVEGAEVAMVLHELDPILVSTVPPKGDVELDEAIYSGAASLRATPATASEFDWTAQSGGMLQAEAAKPRKTPKALWERERDFEIAKVYGGGIAFDDEAVAAWVTATQKLQKLGAPVVGWVHPMAEGATGGGMFDALLDGLKRDTGVPMIRPDAFTLAPDLFLNINHMRPGDGMQLLSRQLMDLALREAGLVQS